MNSFAKPDSFILSSKEIPSPVAPHLFMAASIYGPAATDSQRWKDLLATLDAFKAMGMNAVLLDYGAGSGPRRSRHSC